jgi:DNA-binding LacI/PurR family transcriptional regulator
MSNQRVRVTIRDVAIKANVSPSTVSRALNNFAAVDEVTRTLVWDAARSLGYSLDYLRKLPSTTRSVLMVAPIRFGNAEATLATVERTLSEGIQSFFQNEQVSLQVQRLEMSAENAHSHLENGSIMGVIVLGGIVSTAYVQTLQEGGLPVVVAGAPVKDHPINCVTADFSDGIVQVITHLAQTGRSRIGLVNGPAETASSTLKYHGFRLGLTLHDLTFLPERVKDGDFSPESGYVLTQELLKTCSDLDAIVYADDAMAIGGLRAIEETRRRVPDDIAITGFYNQPLAEYLDPSLTSVYFNQIETGWIAAERLHHMIVENDERVWRVVIPTRLVVRASSQR